MDEELFKDQLTDIVLFPNPVNPQNQNFNAKFMLKNPGKVSIKLYNIRGQMVSNILDETRNSGSNTICQPLPILPSGIYFVKLALDRKNIAVQKVVLIKQF